jgi:hypothetical protein
LKEPISGVLYAHATDGGPGCQGWMRIADFNGPIFIEIQDGSLYGGGISCVGGYHFAIMAAELDTVDVASSAIIGTSKTPNK